MKTALIIAVVVLTSSAGDVAITRGMKQVGDLSAIRWRQVLATARRIATNPSFLAGIGFMAISFFSFLSVLSWADMSLVLPATSLSFVTGTLGARYILKEQVSLMRWIGTFLVCIGVALISIP